MMFLRNLLNCVIVVVGVVMVVDRVGTLEAGTQSCFCRLSGSVDECACSVDSVDDFNNQKIFPSLQNLLQRDFFRYYKVNMEATCPFWADERECSSRACGVETCDEEVPEPLKSPPPNNSHKNKYTKESQKVSEAEECGFEAGTGNTFDPLDKTISGAAEQQFVTWQEFDDAENKFCIEEDHPGDSHYVDLLRNPERYTGYKGNSAARVWKSIYQENCFKPNPKFDKNFLLHPSVTGLCLEKRVFYRLISGLHTGITISVAAHNFKETPGFPGQGTWVRNVDMFKWRFSAEATAGEGPQRLKNLYFVYLMELRALHKVAPYLSGELFFTGNKIEDEETRKAIKHLMDTIQDFPDHFDESTMFQGSQARARELKEEFRQHFLNISRIMDCVDCDKCRLWGKLQTHGIGTALKIIFSKIPPLPPTTTSTSTTTTTASLEQQQQQPQQPILPFQLTRNELVALFNSFGRFAANIREIAEFRRALAT